MYLFIFEDSSLLTGDTITKGDKDSVDNGILDIVDMEDGTRWDSDAWVKIEHHTGE